MRYLLFGIRIMVILIMAAAPAFGHNKDRLPGEVGMEIISDKGAGFQSISHEDLMNRGIRIIKRYLEARRGENYGIVVRNNTPERIGVIIAVDGRNIISGKRSDLGNSESMYVLNAYEHARYDGWRTTSDKVHRFYFTTPQDSYSIRTFGDSSALGVIAAAVYREKVKAQPRLDQQRKEEFSPAPSSLKNPPRSSGKSFADESAGTGFGDVRYSPVINVEFEPESVPVQKTLVKYEWRETLCRKGILRCGTETGNRLWDDNGYAPYPPDYTRE